MGKVQFVVMETRDKDIGKMISFFIGLMMSQARHLKRLQMELKSTLYDQHSFSLSDCSHNNLSYYMA